MMQPKHFSVKEITKNALPIIAASFISIAIDLTDSLIIGHYSTQTLAGIAIGITLYELPTNVLLGSLMAVRIMAPRVNSQQSRETYGIKNVLSFLVPLSAGIVIVSIGGAGIALHLVDSELWHEGLCYFITRIPGLIFQIINTTLVIFLTLWGRKNIPLLVMVMSAPINVFLDVVLIFGIGVFPELGALGAGIASTFSVCIPLLVLLPLTWSMARVHVRQENSAENYHGWQKMALPAASSAFVDYTGSIIFVAILSFSGASALASVRFGMQFHIVAYIWVSSFSTAALYVIGKEHDWQQKHNGVAGIHVIRSLFLGIGVVAAIMVAIVSSLTFVFLAKDTHIIGSYILVSLIIVLLCPIIGFTYGNVTALRLVGDTRSEFLSNFISVWGSQIPIAAIFAFSIGGISPFIGLAGYWIMRAFATHIQVVKNIK
ncbi:MATE family efflux transporter [Corynebacterium sp. sy039]|uniref:MATE family efflux transporter n=1 Tax=Corynebacterium sp. sy039 TaxID=2599641 RepID=UPI0011B815C5|nr:MATE family efflux transporter [Corynebacterium sp. sy039]QDZ41731.1 hypothetical protein FQV43_00030 [Corynebacterium sp. sy039]